MNLSPLEPPIPPEALPVRPPSQPTIKIIPHYLRFLESPDDDLTWYPDTAPPGRLIEDQSTQLEYRGITQEKSSKPSPPAAKHRQAELWRSATVHKNTVAAKLRAVGMVVEADKLELCHSYDTISRCNACGRVTRYPNRCDLFFCPECAPHLSHERHRQVEWWCREVLHPKHLVLTTTNTPTLTPKHIQDFRRAWTNLRKRKRYRSWRGGFYCLEVTQEGRGWHLHLHSLVDSPYIDPGQLARDWAKCTKGRGNIVKVKSCRSEEYLSKVMGYIVKGSALAKWQPEQIAEFVRALSGTRTFGVFGELYGKRTEFAEFIAALKAGHKHCDCGSSSFHYFTEFEWWTFNEAQGNPSTPRPPPVPTTPELAFTPMTIWPD